MKTFNLAHVFADEIKLAAQTARLRTATGRIKRIIGNLIYAYVPCSRLGEICILQDPVTGSQCSAEVIGFDDAVAVLSPLENMTGLSTAAEVHPTGRVLEVPVGRGLLGRVLDGFGRPIDGFGALPFMQTRPIENSAPSALSRRVIGSPLPFGVRVIDGLLTCGEGQRVGIYGPPGAGKSLLLAQILQMAQADVTVLALVGERGREVGEFLERHVTGEARERLVAVVATSDRSSVERAKAASTAMTVAEYFRDAGARVLLMVDSVTRLARALREIGLAAGEPPTRRGYPPSIFTALPALFERAGNAERGSITAIFTVLVEGDGTADPIAEETKSLLDGHIVLSPKLAQIGHFPAVDVVSSLSRVMLDIVSPEHEAAARRIRQLISKYSEIEFLIQVGEYKAGNDLIGDEAIEKRAEIEQFLRQSFKQTSDFGTTLSKLWEI